MDADTSSTTAETALEPGARPTAHTVAIGSPATWAISDAEDSLTTAGADARQRAREVPKLM
jgi:hypothetical protein